jgi:rpsU-divergently transcribed protein
MRDKLFNAAVKSIHQWDDQLIEELCKKHNLKQVEIRLIFPKGIESLADEFFQRVDKEMLKVVSDKLHTMPIHLQVAQLLEARLNYMNEHKKVSLKILSMKSGISYQISHIINVADLIWQNVKHKSSGFDFYTRRMILANVYKNCLIHFKKDVSMQEMNIYAAEQLQFVGEITKFKKKLCKTK